MQTRLMTTSDIEAVSTIHAAVFAQQHSSTKWVTCNLNAYPRVMIYVTVNEDNQVVGYIQWLQKSGFRKETVMELEQIAVLPEFQGRKIGTELIKNSLELVKEYLISQDATLKAVLVSTRTDNKARNLYEITLGVKVAATIQNLYSADEVLMVTKYL